MSTRYQRDRELRRALLAREMRNADRGDYIVGAVGIVGCIALLVLAMLGWL